MGISSLVRQSADLMIAVLSDHPQRESNRQVYLYVTTTEIRWADRSAVDRLLCKQDVASSNLAQSTTFPILMARTNLSFAFSAI